MAEVMPPRAPPEGLLADDRRIRMSGPAAWQCRHPAPPGPWETRWHPGFWDLNGFIQGGIPRMWPLDFYERGTNIHNR